MSWEKANWLAGPELVGEPTYGTFQGALETTALISSVHPVWTRVRREKRWQWFGAVGPDVAIGAALFVSGYAAQVFLWVFDRGSQELLCDQTVTLPRGLVRVSTEPGRGRVARYGRGSRSLTIDRRGDQVEIRCDLFGVDAVLEFHGAQVPPMTAVCPVSGGMTNVTQKQAGLRVQGVVRMGSRVWHLGERARGHLDYTHGMMARRTTWRWAIGGGVAGGEDVGFNLVAGFNDGLENALWRGGEVFRLPKVRFEVPESPGLPWRVTSLDSRVDLTLEVEGVRRAVFDARLIESIYTQPIGRWTGRIGDIELEDVSGVAEDHRALW